MAMPASCIGLLTCVNGTCSSISAAACGTTTGPKCLTALATAAGKTARMSCFFGYNDTMCITPTSITGIAIAGATCSVTTYAPAFNTACVCTSYSSWLVPATPVTPAPAGNSHNIVICANSGAPRCGTVCYDSYCGQCCTVTLCQLGITWCSIAVDHLGGGGCGGTYACANGCLTPAISTVGDYYCVCICANLCTAKCCTVSASVCVTCAGVCKMCCCVTGLGICICPSISFLVCNGNCVDYQLYACHSCPGCGGSSISCLCLKCITCVSSHGYYCCGTPQIDYAATN